MNKSHAQMVLNTPRAIDLRKNPHSLKTLIKTNYKPRTDGLTFLQKYFQNAQEVIVVDPYFYQCSKNQDKKEYIEELKFVLSNFKTINKLHIIYNKNYCDEAIRNMCFDITECDITDVHTDIIHDRLWLKDRLNGKLVGCSFNGLGRSKISFILNLPAQDVINLKFFLQRNNLVKKDFLIIE